MNRFVVAMVFCSGIIAAATAAATAADILIASPSTGAHVTPFLESNVPSIHVAIETHAGAVGRYPLDSVLCLEVRQDPLRLDTSNPCPSI